MEIKITSIRITKPTPLPNGKTRLAYFNMEVAGLSIWGCQLLKTAANGFVAHLPSMADPAAEQIRGIRFAEESARHAVMDAARRAYVALGGEGGEWTPRVAEFRPFRMVGGEREG